MHRRDTDNPVSGLLRGAGDVARAMMGAATGAAKSVAEGAWRAGGAIAGAMRDAAHGTIDAAYGIGSDLANAARRMMTAEAEPAPRRIPVRARRGS